LFFHFQDAAEKFPVSYEAVSEGICASYDDDTLSVDTGYKSYKTQSVYVLACWQLFTIIRYASVIKTVGDSSQFDQEVPLLQD
jgi:hypothetical protein